MDSDTKALSEFPEEWSAIIEPTGLVPQWSLDGVEFRWRVPRHAFVTVAELDVRPVGTRSWSRKLLLLSTDMEEVLPISELLWEEQPESAAMRAMIAQALTSPYPILDSRAIVGVRRDCSGQFEPYLTYRLFKRAKSDDAVRLEKLRAMLDSPSLTSQIHVTDANRDVLQVFLIDGATKLFAGTIDIKTCADE